MAAKVYGPYDKKNGRQIVIVQDEEGKRRTISYPKFLMEQRLGRELDPNKETVDHIDRDFKNNDPLNLRIIERSQHLKEDVKRRKPAELLCEVCNEKFIKNASYIYTNRKDGKAGPFCSRKCAGTYTMDVRQGKREPLVVDFEEFEKKHKEFYYPIKKVDGKGLILCEKCLNESGLGQFYEKKTAQDEQCENCKKVVLCVYLKSIKVGIFEAIVPKDEEKYYPSAFYVELGENRLWLTMMEDVPEHIKPLKQIGELEYDIEE